MDLVGFTGLAEDQDPEEVQEFLGRYFELTRSVIGRYGGTLEKLIGDAVMAVWGTPTAHEDGPERAVRAALDLLAAVPGLSPPAGLPRLAARAAVATGEAAVDIAEKDQALVAGDIVNIAARLETSAEAGTALVDVGTYRATRGAIAYRSLGELEMRGRRGAVATWQPLRVVAMRGGGRRGLLPEPRFVGRATELQALKDALQRAATDRDVQLVALTGPPGIGKSRLVWELEKYLDGVVTQAYWHRAGSPAYGSGSTYHALREMVRKRAEIGEATSTANAKRALRACIERFVPDPAEHHALERALAALLGLRPPPGGEREALFTAWRTFFERVADAGIAGLVFEDAESADAALLDFIEHVAEWSRGHPMLVVVLCRPELIERRPHWRSGLRNTTVLDVRPLEAADVAAVLDDLAPELPRRLRGRVVERARGVPLYAVETLRMLADRGVLAAEGTAYRVLTEADELNVPETLHALLAARLDALPADERALLRDASVLGRDFPVDALRAVADPTDPDDLERLVGRELLQRDPSDPSGVERYRFTDWLLQEVAYRGLGRRLRRERHIAAAGYYATLGETEAIASVAGHLYAAAMAVPHDTATEALARRAREALSAAADRASALYSPEEALLHLDRAITLTDDEAERASLDDRAGAAALAAGHLGEAEEHLRAALRSHQSHGDRRGAALSTARLGTVLLYRYEMDDAVGVLEGALIELSDAGMETEDPLMITLSAELARAHLALEHPDLAVAWADRALAASAAGGWMTPRIDALVTKGSALSISGNDTQGMALLEDAVRLAEANDVVRGELRARHNLALALLQDDPARALAVASEGMERARHFGSLELLVRLTILAAGEAAIDAGSWDWAVETLEDLDRDDLSVPDQIDLQSTVLLLAGWRGDPAAARRLEHLGQRISDVPGQAVAHAAALLDYRRSGLALALGQPDRALGYADEASRALRDAGYDRWALREAWLASSRAALWVGDAARVTAQLNELQRRGISGRWVVAQRATLTAGLAALGGVFDEADAGYDAAARWWRDLGLPMPLALCQLERSVLRRGSSGADAAELEAAAIFEGLGARLFLDRIGGFVA